MTNSDIEYQDVCCYFFEKAERRDDLKLLKLMKLVYISHGLFLSIKGKGQSFIAKNQFEAWLHGPVLPSLYKQYKREGHDGFIESIQSRDKKIEEESIDAKILDKVNARYGKLNLLTWLV